MFDPFGAIHAQCYSKADVDAARQQGRDEVLKLAAKIVANLEKALVPDFASQLEAAMKTNAADHTEGA